MSTTVMSLCWPLQMPPTPKAVLISLADNANDHGECWPSIPTICERTCFSERAVHAAIKWLEDTSALKADRSNGRKTRYMVDPKSYQPPQEMHHRSKCATASSAVEPPQEMQEPPQQQQSPPQEMRSNHQEPSRTVKSNRQIAALDLSSWPSQPSPKILADWLAMRRKKRADVSETVISAMAKQLQAAANIGWTVDECLTECVFRNWQGFKAAWLGPKELTGTDPPHGRQQPTGKQVQAIKNLEAMKHGGLDSAGDSYGLSEVGVLRLGTDTGR